MGLDSWTCVLFGWKITDLERIHHLENEYEILSLLRNHLEEGISDAYPFAKIGDLNLKVIYVPNGGFKYDCYIGVTLSPQESWVYKDTVVSVDYLAKICRLPESDTWNDLGRIVADINNESTIASLYILPFLT